MYAHNAHVPTGTGPAWPEYRDTSATARAYIEAALDGDMQADALFAPLTHDYEACRRTDNPHIMRFQSVSEVLFDSLDYADDGPAMSDVMGLLCRAAAGADIRAEAAALIDRMATAWSRHNTED